MMTPTTDTALINQFLSDSFIAKIAVPTHGPNDYALISDDGITLLWFRYTGKGFYSMWWCSKPTNKTDQQIADEFDEAHFWMLANTDAIRIEAYADMTMFLKCGVICELSKGHSKRDDNNDVIMIWTIGLWSKLKGREVVKAAMVAGGQSAKADKLEYVWQKKNA